MTDFWTALTALCDKGALFEFREGEPGCGP